MKKHYKKISIIQRTKNSDYQNRFKKPNLFDILYGGFITLVFDRLRLSKTILPKKIGKYSLLHSIKKNNDYNYSFGIGVYTSRNKKYFIKNWKGPTRDLNYFSLINEYYMNTILWKKCNMLKIDDKISVANPVDLLQEKNSLSVVFEYIEGKNLSEYSSYVQIKILKAIFFYLQKMNESLSMEDMLLIPERTLWFYLLSFPFFAIVSTIALPGKTALIWKNFAKAMLSLHRFRNEKLVLTHRDLDSSNIMMRKGKIYLTDCETMVRTIPFYDQVRIPLVQDNFSQFVKKNSAFLKTYIIFHLIVCSLGNSKLKMKYISHLS